MEQYDEIQVIDSNGSSDSDIESDSDLFMLASSLFDGIEGIETGGSNELGGGGGGDVRGNVQVNVLLVSERLGQ